LETKQLAEQVKSKISVVEVVGRYVQLTRAGNNHKGLCPFHNEATPSFLVSNDKGIYKCFGCGEGGDAISFISKMENISYNQAVITLAESAGFDDRDLLNVRNQVKTKSFDKELELLNFVAGFFSYYLLNAKEGELARNYLETRGIDSQTIKLFGIGLAPKDSKILLQTLTSNGYSHEQALSVGIIGLRDNGDVFATFRNRIMFAVKNENSKVVGFSGRVYDKADIDQAKYVNSQESDFFLKSQLIYNLDQAKPFIRTGLPLIIVEGFMDVIAVAKAGIQTAVATMGTALTINHAKLIARHTNDVILVLDGDKAGLAATSKAISILLQTGINVSVAPLPVDVDPDDFVKKHGAIGFNRLITSAIGAIEFQYAYLKQGLDLYRPDDMVEYERRLSSFANSLPIRSIGQTLFRKWKDEQFHRRQTGKKTNDKEQRTLKKVNNYALQQPQKSSKLPVEGGEIKAEKELIYYMLQDKEVFKIVESSIGTALNIDIHRKIVQAIEAYYFKYDIMEVQLLLMNLSEDARRVTENIIDNYKLLPKKWSTKSIKDLTNRVQLGALKLERAGKKEKLETEASHEQRLKILKDLTTDQLY